MKKVNYILKRLRNIQYKKMIQLSKEIGHKKKCFSLFVFIDMLICGMKYGAGYMDYFEFEFYLLNKKERKTFITSTINNSIIKKYNDQSNIYKLSNKAIFNEIFKDFIGRSFMILKRDEFEIFEFFLHNKTKIIVKPLNEMGGKGIELISLSENTDIFALFQKLLNQQQLLIEEVIVQHHEMAKLYDKSVNTMRILTFLKNNGEVEILKVILKIGCNGVVDNFSSGGMYTFVDEQGMVFVPAINEMGKIFLNHPISGTELIGFKIPFFQEAKDLVIKSSLMIPSVRYIGWDVAISETGPVLIEGNEFSGIFQIKPSLNIKKVGDLLNYRNFMDI